MGNKKRKKPKQKTEEKADNQPIPTPEAQNSDQHSLTDEGKRLKSLADRSIFANGPVTEDLVNGIAEEMLALIQKDPDAPIYLCIQTVGGDEKAAQGLHNFVKGFLKLAQLITVLLGPADRAASLLWMSGSKRQIAADTTLDIADTERLGFDILANHPKNGSGHQTNVSPLAALNQADGPITAEQAFEAGIATDLLP